MLKLVAAVSSLLVSLGLAALSRRNRQAPTAPSLPRRRARPKARRRPRKKESPGQEAI